MITKKFIGVTVIALLLISGTRNGYCATADSFLPAPVLMAPGDGWEVTDIAADFRWNNLEEPPAFADFVKIELTQGPLNKFNYINYHDQPLPGTWLPLTDILQDPDKPWTCRDDRGRLHPVLYSQASGEYGIILDVAAKGSGSLTLLPAEGTGAGSGIEGNWDEDKGRGFITNGLVTCRYGEDGAALYMGQDELAAYGVLRKIRLDAWLDDQDRGLMFPAQVDDLRLPDIGTASARLLDAKLIIHNGSVTLELKKTYDDHFSTNIRLTERFTLYEGLPSLSYRLDFENKGTEDYYIVNQHGTTFRADFAGTFDGDKMAVNSSGNEYPLSSDFSEKPRWWDAPWFLVLTRKGYAMGVSTVDPVDSELFSLTSRWNFNNRSISMVPVSPELGSRPLRLSPGKTVSVGNRYVIFSPGVDAQEGMDAFYNGMKQGSPLCVQNSLAVFKGGKPVQYAPVKMLNINESHSSSENKTMLTGMKLPSNGSGLMLAAVAIDPGKNWQVVADVTGLAAGDSIGIFTMEPSGRKSRVAAIGDNGSMTVDMHISALQEDIVEIVLTASLEGKGRKPVILNSFEIIPRKPEPPRLISPLDNQEITDVALFYKWYSVEDCNDYEIQASGSPDFSDAVSYSRSVSHRKNFLFPEELLLPGTWYWRVRAINFQGISSEWSDTRKMRINNDYEMTAPVREVSPQQPLFHYRSWGSRDVSTLKDVIPDDLKENVVLDLCPTGKSEVDFFQYCRDADEAGISYVLDAGHLEKERCLSLAEFEWACRNMPHLVGSACGEWFWGFLDLKEDQEYFRRLMILCGKYGRYHIWGDAHGLKFPWIQMTERPEIMETVDRYGDYLIPVHKTTMATTAFTVQGALQGWWLTGRIKNFGIWSDAWFWENTGQKKLGETYGRRQGDLGLIPPTFAPQQYLMYLLQGSSAFAFEGGHTWDREGNTTEHWDKFLVPFMRAVVKMQLIPSREETISNIKVAVKTVPEGNRDHGSSYLEYAKLYEVAYHTNNTWQEIIPNTGNNYFVPLLPRDVLKAPAPILTIGEDVLQDKDSLQKIFDEQYLGFYQGDAFVGRAGNTLVIMNTNENKDVPQSYDIPLQYEFLKGISGTTGPHQYIMAKIPEDGSSIWFQANCSYPERETKIVFHSENEPIAETEPPDALLQADWDKGKKSLTLELSHESGPVEVRVDFATTRSGNALLPSHSIYVSLKGRDDWPGTLKMPVASLERALELASKFRRGNTGQHPGAGHPSGMKDSGILQSPVRILVRQGTYYFPETLEIGSDLSGTALSPLIIQNYPGERPTLSGGRKIEARWEQLENGIWKCKLAGERYTELDFNQLYINGERQVRARYPNGNSLYPDQESYVHAKGADAWPHHALYYDPETFSGKEWARPEDGVLHIFNRSYWGNMQFRITGRDTQKNTLFLGEGGWQLNPVFQGESATGINRRSRFFVDNIFEELDTAKEWYFDRIGRVLYYLPPQGMDPGKVTVEVSHLKQLIEIKGSMQHPVHDIIIRGFRISHTEVTYLETYDDPSVGDWAIHRGGAVFIEGAEDCAVEQCFFDATGGNGVFVNNYALRIRVEGNIFTETGESAVCLVGESHLIKEGNYACTFCGEEHAWAWGVPSKEIPSECTVNNNLIHDIGVFGKQTAGVFLSLSMKNRVTHNHIYDLPRAGICINDGWFGGHDIAYNDVYNAVRETGDHGPINTWGRESFWCKAQSHAREPNSHPPGDVKKDAMYTTSIQYNRFSDNHGWGLDLDDGTSNYHIYKNLCLGIAIKIREGAYRTVENNIVVYGAAATGFHIANEENEDRFFHNIILAHTKAHNPDVDIDYSRAGPGGQIYDFIQPPLSGIQFGYWDYNLFYSDLGEFSCYAHYIREQPIRHVKYDLEKWRGLGFDRHSVFARPLFVDPEAGDFRVQPGSPALELGFENFPMDRFGLTPGFSNAWLEDHNKKWGVSTYTNYYNVVNKR